jgi:hypothetical protein
MLCFEANTCLRSTQGSHGLQCCLFAGPLGILCCSRLIHGRSHTIRDGFHFDFILPVSDLHLQVDPWATLALSPGARRDVAKGTTVKSATHYKSRTNKKHEKLLIVLQTPHAGTITFFIGEPVEVSSSRPYFTVLLQQCSFTLRVFRFLRFHVHLRLRYRFYLARISYHSPILFPCSRIAFSIRICHCSLSCSCSACFLCTLPSIP